MSGAIMKGSKTIPKEPLFKVHLDNDTTGMRGVLVIHSLGPRGACGGVRITPDIEGQEIADLARVMTYKYSFWERPMGGAKAGLKIPAGATQEHRASILKSFGRQLSPILIANIYHPGMDMDCSADDLNMILSEAGLTGGETGDSAYFTSLTALGALTGTTKFLGINPSSCKIAIEGMGRIGIYLGQEIEKWGGKVIAASTVYGGVVNTNGLSISEVVAKRNLRGDRFVQEQGPWESVPKEKLFEVGADIFVPCARTWSINEGIARQLKARAVIPAANVPCTEEGERILLDRGILLLPDFICNAGGIIGTGLSDLGGKPSVIKGLLCNRFESMIIRLLRKSEEVGTFPINLARMVSQENYYRHGKSSFSRLAMPERIFNALRWRGLIPRPYVLRQAHSKTLKLIETKFK